MARDQLRHVQILLCQKAVTAHSQSQAAKAFTTQHPHTPPSIHVVAGAGNTTVIYDWLCAATDFWQDGSDDFRVGSKKTSELITTHAHYSKRANILQTQTIYFKYYKCFL